MLDIVRANSSTIFALSQGKDPIKEKCFEYTHQLVMEFVKPTTEIRNQVFQASKIKHNNVLNSPVLQPEPHRNDGPALGATRKRCTMCQKTAAGNDYCNKRKVIFPCNIIWLFFDSIFALQYMVYGIYSIQYILFLFHILRLLLQALLKNLPVF